ncbi:3222_t:CDS:2 [Paraglomus brasilianum]|uniref:3222_t:CDS:1 n=1 Tax=Paraglomus brasilianum TaxID=144538 RepID=A0A9N9ADM3_9GLOM|nr:3222_t:CDS:2 [Paraglomus brasilianum]
MATDDSVDDNNQMLLTPTSFIHDDSECSTDSRINDPDHMSDIPDILTPTTPTHSQFHIPRPYSSPLISNGSPRTPLTPLTPRTPHTPLTPRTPHTPLTPVPSHISYIPHNVSSSSYAPCLTNVLIVPPHQTQATAQLFIRDGFQQHTREYRVLSWLKT